MAENCGGNCGGCACRKKLASCEIHGEVHANLECPERDPEECAKEILGLVLSPEEVKAWFERPNPRLGGLTPRRVANAGLANVVRDLAMDMITGNPS